MVASSLVYARLEEARAACPGLVGMSARAIATVHTALAIQRAKYAANASGRRKNATLLFFDRQDQDESAVAAAIATPPEWAVEFVGDRASSGELTAIVDTAYFVDSVWGAETWFSCREAVFVDQSAEAIATLDLVWSR